MSCQESDESPKVSTEMNPSLGFHCPMGCRRLRTKPSTIQGQDFMKRPLHKSTSPQGYTLRVRWTGNKYPFSPQDRKADHLPWPSAQNGQTNKASPKNSRHPEVVQKNLEISSVQFSPQSCPTLCDSVDFSTPGLPVHHQLPELTQTHVYRVRDAIQPSHLLLSPSPPALSFPASGSFPMRQFFPSGGQSTRVSASTSILPMNTQDWSPLGWTGCISLQSKWLSRVFSNTTVQKHQFFSTQLSL